MTQSRRIHLWIALALVAVLFVASAFWFRGTLLPNYGDHSPLSAPSVAETSPLSTPAPSAIPTAPPSSWSSGGVVLLWVVLGIGLALGIAFVILRWYRRAV